MNDRKTDGFLFQKRSRTGRHGVEEHRHAGHPYWHPVSTVHRVRKMEKYFPGTNESNRPEAEPEAAETALAEPPIYIKGLPDIVEENGDEIVTGYRTILVRRQPHATGRVNVLSPSGDLYGVAELVECHLPPEEEGEKQPFYSWVFEPLVRHFDEGDYVRGRELDFWGIILTLDEEEAIVSCPDGIRQSPLKDLFPTYPWQDPADLPYKRTKWKL